MEVLKMMRTITVKGTGCVSAKPDYIILSMVIESKHRDYSKAMEGASLRIGQLQNAAIDSGYKKEDLKTVSFHADTQYESVKDRHGNYTREFVGYACIYRLKLAFDFNSKQLAKVISAIADSGADPEFNIAFTVKHPEKINDELLENAARNARKKAEILCKASGTEMGQLLSMDYNWGELNVVSRTKYEMKDSLMPLGVMSKCCSPEIEPDNIDVSDTVSFTWEIR